MIDDDDDFVPPVRTDSTETDPYDSVRPEPVPSLVVRDEDDDEKRARHRLEQVEQKLPFPETKRWTKAFEDISDAVVGVVQDAQRVALSVVKIILPGPQMGGVERSLGLGREIIGFHGLYQAQYDQDGDLHCPELERRRQRLLDGEKGTTMEIVPKKVYEIMEAVWTASRGPLDFTELQLVVNEGFQRQPLAEQLARVPGRRRHPEVLESIPVRRR